MTRLNILAIDDDPLQLEFYKEIFKESPYKLVYTSTSGEQLPNILNKEEVDVALLDIEIASYSGFKLAEHINQNHENIKIIFISSYKTFALDAYNFYPLDFIVKPVDVFRLFQTLNRVSHLVADQHATRIGVQISTGFSLVKIEDILFINKSFNKTVLHLLNGETIESKDKLEIFETKLGKHKFYRIHKSYLVNLSKIKKIQKDDFMNSFNLILYDSSSTLPVSKHRVKELKESIVKQYSF
ncbi:LytR/AlgR family response regulator transcription factor [Alkalicoccobacillus gibsonii]|uniref:LytR/AlgR family response regulator transcription factor n=1 Tax=Alkalicoccobacillus gibsonii TaxID=79881 RepID=UPI003517E660